MSDQPKCVLVVDRHPVFRRGLIELIRQEPGFTLCGEADSVETAMKELRRSDPDLALVDITLIGGSGIDLVKSMISERPSLAVFVLSAHEESLYGPRSLRAGAKGYVMKNEAITTLIRAMNTVLSGNVYVSPALRERIVFKAIPSLEEGLGSPLDKLSDRELEVLQLLGRGFGTREIAKEVHLSLKTVETHRAHIKEKLGFRDSDEMVRFAVDWYAQEHS